MAYMFPSFRGNELRETFSRFYENAFNGSPNTAKVELDNLEEVLIQRYITTKRDPEKIRKKIKRIRAVLNQNISKKGRKRKLSKYVKQLIEAIEDTELNGGDPVNTLTALKNEFSHEFGEFTDDKKKEQMQNLKDILTRIESLGPKFEDEKVRKEFRKLREKIGELKESLSSVPGDKRVIKDAGKEAKRFHKRANRVLEIASGAPEPEGNGEEESEKELPKKIPPQVVEEIMNNRQGGEEAPLG